MTETTDKREEEAARAAELTAARLVWAELQDDDETYAREWRTAVADYWTGDAATDDERVDRLVVALVEWLAESMEQAHGTDEAIERAQVHAWRMTTAGARLAAAIDGAELPALEDNAASADSGS